MSKGEVMDEVISLDLSEMGQKDIDHASPSHSRKAAAASPLNITGQRTPSQKMVTVGIQSSTTSLRPPQAFDFGAGFKKIAHPEKKTPSPGVAKTKSSTELGSTNDVSTTTSMKPSIPFAPEDSTFTSDAGPFLNAAAHDPALSPLAAVHQAAPDTAYAWSSDFVKQESTQRHKSKWILSEQRRLRRTRPSVIGKRSAPPPQLSQSTPGKQWRELHRLE